MPEQLTILKEKVGASAMTLFKRTFGGTKKGERVRWEGTGPSRHRYPRINESCSATWGKLNKDAETEVREEHPGNPYMTDYFYGIVRGIATCGACGNDNINLLVET